MAFCSTSAVLACARAIAAPPPLDAGAAANLTLSTDDGGEEAAPVGTRPAATKVVATLGPASRQPAILEALLRCGMSCARLDASNSRPLFWHLEAFDMLQARTLAPRDTQRAAWRGAMQHADGLASQEAVARTQRMCSVMLDTKGPYEVTVRRDPATPRPRGGGPDASPDDYAAGGPAPLSISADQTVVLAGDAEAEWEAARPSVLPLSDPAFLAGLAPGDLVHVARYLASGMERASLFLEVQEVSTRLAPRKRVRRRKSH